MASDKKWTRGANPPGRLFFGEKEENFQNQITNEITERIIAQQVLYYPVDPSISNYHSLYGESIKKSFLPPVQVYALVEFHGTETTTTGYGLDRRSKITVHFNKRRLEADKDLYVREGDFLSYNSHYYEIVTLSSPRELFASSTLKVEISATCVRARDGTFNAQ